MDKTIQSCVNKPGGFDLGYTEGYDAAAQAAYVPITMALIWGLLAGFVGGMFVIDHIL